MRQNKISISSVYDAQKAIQHQFVISSIKYRLTLARLINKPWLNLNIFKLVIFKPN